MEGEVELNKLSHKDLKDNGKFGFAWRVGNSELEERTKRNRFRRPILNYNVVEQCKELRSYIPMAEEPSALCTVSKIATLVKGICLILSYKLYYWLGEAIFKVKKNEAINLLATEVPNAVGRVKVTRRRKATGQRARFQNAGRTLPAAAAPEATESAVQDTVPNVEAEIPPIQRQGKQTRTRKAKSASQILRMLTRKAAELNPMANILNETPLCEQPQLNGAGFYDNTTVDPVADTQQLITLFRTDLEKESRAIENAEQVDETVGIREDMEARRLSRRSPVPNTQRLRSRGRVTRQSAAFELNRSSIELEPIAHGELRARPPRSRRLKFADDETMISSILFKKQIRDGQPDIDKMIQVAERYHALPSKVLQRKIRGFPAILMSGRKLFGKALKEMVSSIELELPITEAVRETLRAEASSMTSQPSEVGVEVQQGDLGESRSILPLLETTDSLNADSRMAEEISSLNIGTSILQPIGEGLEVNVVGVNDIAMEISHVLSPPRRRSSRVNGGVNEVEIHPPTSPVVTEEKLITFEEVMPPNNVNTKRDAANFFFTILKHQKNGKVELIQTEFYGPIKIKVLQPQLRSSPDLESSYLSSSGSGL